MRRPAAGAKTAEAAERSRSPLRDSCVLPHGNARAVTVAEHGLSAGEQSEHCCWSNARRLQRIAAAEPLARVAAPDRGALIAPGSPLRTDGAAMGRVRGSPDSPDFVVRARGLEATKVTSRRKGPRSPPSAHAQLHREPHLSGLFLIAAGRTRGTRKAHLRSDGLDGPGN